MTEYDATQAEATDYDAPSKALRPPSELGYAEAASELDGIIRELDQGLIDVDRLEARFRHAIELVEELDRRIHNVRERVDALLPRLDAITTPDEG